jgi:multisubunit Na+/H+ antiporter MnhG subunit
MKNPPARNLHLDLFRLWAIRLLRLESGLLLLIDLYLLRGAIFLKVSSVSALAGVMIFSLVGAIGLFYCSLAYARKRSWGRAPAVLANLIALGVSYFMLKGGLILFSLLLATLAVATLLTSLFGYQEGAQSGQ